MGFEECRGSYWAQSSPPPDHTCATLPRHVLEVFCCKLPPHHCAAAPVNTTAGITGTMDQLYHCYRVKDCIAAKAK